jgi:hypothetical protein
MTLEKLHSEDMTVWTKERPQASTLHKELMQLRDRHSEWEKLSSPGKSTLTGSPIPNGQHTSNTTQADQVVLRNTHVHTYTYMYVTIGEKKL